MDKKKILVIDDESILRKTLEQALAQEFDVVTAIDGQEGYKKAKEEKPNLIMLDIIMPNMNGMDCLKKIKQDPETKDIPVVLLTNVEKSESIADGIALGAKGYMVKGDYTTDDIIKNVKKFVG